MVGKRQKEAALNKKINKLTAVKLNETQGKRAQPNAWIVETDTLSD